MQVIEMKTKFKNPYTHRISYWTISKTGVKVQASFPTTSDAVKIHLNKMKESDLCFDIKVEVIGKST
jgi:hypothetical protein